MVSCIWGHLKGLLAQKYIWPSSSLVDLGKQIRIKQWLKSKQLVQWKTKIKQNICAL